MAICNNRTTDRLIFRSAIFTILLLLGLTIFASKSQTASADCHRFFYSGDGQIHLIDEKSGRTFTGRFRTGAGDYDAAALRQICLVFGAPYGSQQMGVSLRLIEFLDFIEDRHNQGARITITSGYRSPEYNTSLRKHGRTKEVRLAAGESSKEAAQSNLVKAQSAIDNAAKKGVIHKKTAARKISRLTKLVNSVNT